MSRTLILNISSSAQTLPPIYGSHVVAVGHGRVVADESSVVVSEMGGFADMDGIWAVSAISTDTALGDIDVASGGVALLAQFVGGGSGGGGGPVSWSDILNKPPFATVATSGSYADLSNKPTLATVATSGSYSDLSGTPTLPSAANTAATDVGATGAAGVLSTYARGDHQHAHGNQAGGSLHSAATTIAAGFMSAADKSKLDSLATVAATGAYADLSGAPSLASVATTGSYADLSNKPTLFSGAYSDLTGKPALADVATSGAYADLSGTPSLAAVATSGSYADLTGKPALAAVATSGSADDLANQPYDIIGNSTGSLVVNQVVLRAFAPRALVLTGITQASSSTAAVQVKVNNVAAVFPQAVSAGALITAVVTAAGTDCWFSITGKVA